MQLTTGTVPYLIAYNWFKPQGSYLEGINNISQLSILSFDQLYFLFNNLEVQCVRNFIPSSYPMRNWDVKSNPSTELFSIGRFYPTHPIFSFWIPWSKHNLKQVGRHISKREKKVDNHGGKQKLPIYAWDNCISNQLVMVILSIQTT